VRKAGGVFYTPTFIVENIVQNTVGQIVNLTHTPKDVAKLKFLDPACGAPRGAIKQYLKRKETLRIDSSMPQYC
jgi:hypothetical protein